MSETTATGTHAVVPSKLTGGTLLSAALAVAVAQIGLSIPAVINGYINQDLGTTSTQLTWVSDAFLVPVTLLRDRRRSFVELYAYDNQGKTNYGTACYLGGGYFITVKHAVVPLPDEGEPKPAGRRIDSIRLTWGSRRVAAKLVDAGDADVEVHSGDWAIVKVSEAVDLPALRVNAAFSYDFAEPIVRLGNDYSKGIILSTGYVGQRTGNGLVTCLTDGHPGVSGGGVLDRQGDYRFSFILPLRREMFRKVPANTFAMDPVAATTD